MKRLLLLVISAFFISYVHAQVTQLIANRNMEFRVQLNVTQSIYESGIDSTLWVTNGTVAGTYQLSSTIKATDNQDGLLNGKYVFTAILPETGEEFFITDGTIAGTVLLKDINPGTEGSVPENNSTAILFNGYVYFPAITALNGCEIWRTDGTTANTTMVKDINPGTADGINPDDLYFDFFILNNYIYFPATTPTEGYELWRSDGTTANTNLVMDINPGMPGSQPLMTGEKKIIFKGNLYFVAVTANQGCELWRTNGTTTSIVSDIGTGATSGIDSINFSITIVGTNLVFEATTPTFGNEYWYSTDGTPANTAILKDITAGAGSSNLQDVFNDTSNTVNNFFLFTVSSPSGTTANIWRTDGTPAGTFTLVTNISTGTSMSNYFTFFYLFKNRVYFLINDNVHANTALWSTDGIDATAAHTSFLIDMGAKGTDNFNFLNTIVFPDKFVFIYPTDNSFATYSMWQCNGTVAGTTPFKSFPANPEQIVIGGVVYLSGAPVIFTPFSFDIATNAINSSLYKGKFFFSAYSTSSGEELWISDGTGIGTVQVKDINPGTDNGMNFGYTYFGYVLYTNQGIFFPANDGAHGIELWKSDGTDGGTFMVKDINPLADSSNPVLNFFLANGKVLFNATDGTPDDDDITDLYVVDGLFTPLPVQLLDFTVTPKKPDALLKWSTAQEINSDYFTIQSSDDAQHWNSIGKVSAMGNSSVKTDYSFIDPGIMISGKNLVYYRLLSTDVDGKISNSEVISLRIDNTDQWRVQINSNPVRNNLNLVLSGIKSKAIISVLNLEGKQIYKRQVQNQNGLFSIPLNVQSGIYILQVRSENQTQTIKFVRE